MKDILIVDDDADILDAISMVLKEEGYAVKTSLRADYLETLDGNLPDVILLDILLSGVDGRTVAEKLKSQEKTKNIPIIMISAYPNAAETVLQSGADDFLAKPFETNELLAKVKKYSKK